MKKIYLFFLVSLLVISESDFAQQGKNSIKDKTKPKNSTVKSNDYMNGLDKLCGIWEIIEDGSKSYLKVTRDKSGKYIFDKGGEYQGKPLFNPFMLENGDMIYLIPTNDKLVGKFASYNFYATHGQLYNYQVTLEFKSANLMNYSEYCSIRGGENIQYKATRISSYEIPIKDMTKIFLGSWGCMGQQSVIISYANNKYKFDWSGFGGYIDYYEYVSFFDNKLTLKPEKGNNIVVTLINPKEIEIIFEKNSDGTYNAQQCVK